MKKALVFIIALAVICMAAIGLMTSKYMTTEDFESEHFDAGYIINGIRCYDMDYADAVKKVTADWNASDILVVGTLDEPLTTYTQIDCTYDIAEQIARVKEDHTVLCALNHYVNFPVSVQIPMKIASYSKKFKKEVKSSDFLDRGVVTETTDAYVDTADPDFPIIPEVYGSKPDTQRYFEDILACIELGQKKFIFDEANYIAIPEVKRDDPQLLAYQKFCRQYLKQKITYDLGEDSFTIPQTDLEGLLKDDLSGKPDSKAVRSYVKGIAKKYDNVDKKRTFTTLNGKEITIDNANYGWSVDQDGETDQLLEDISSHKDVSRQPVWATTGYGTYSLNIGDTYIDIDVSQQKLYYFENGKRIFTSDVVTGCRNTGTITPTGLYSVLNKAQNVSLKGKNVDGSEYESFVNYWIAFIGSSYGMHDANWRSSFGGDIWVSNGSHGCVNMPPKKIPDLYNMVNYGTPVIVHY